ncbi:MAG: response regulator [Saccharospirillaceae bacterium]|nr:response regulator [Saccharospirillaceae bacterium]MCD8531469.1 response regulator [Saccharospirillaceae bacterium]
MAALNILIVDDAAFIRDLVKKAVRDTYPGCELHEAIDGRKAISVMNSKSINLVLCDWEMPEVSGIEVLQWMRADERYKKVPFMMITSRGERDHVLKAVEAGVSEYIGKPFTRENFVGKLAKLVYKHLKIRPNEGESKPALGGGSADVLGAASVGSAPKLAGDLGGASVLMGATPKAMAAPRAGVTADMGGASVLMGEPPAAARKGATKARGLASVRFGSGGSAKLVIKDISLQELIGVFRREGPLPALLEQVVLDIVDQDSGDVARINGYVRMMQAQEPHPDAQTIQMLIRYVDDDPEKLATLSRFIAKVR